MSMFVTEIHCCEIGSGMENFGSGINNPDLKNCRNLRRFRVFCMKLAYNTGCKTYGNVWIDLCTISWTIK